MTTRRGLFVAPFDALADPRVVGDLAASAEAAGWDGFFLWDHLQYGDRVAEIADVWTCCAAVAMRTERLLLGPMVTPLARRRPQVLARQAASLAVLSGGRFVLGLGLGDDGVGEFSAFGDEADPRVRGRMLDEGLDGADLAAGRGARSTTRAAPHGSRGPLPTGARRADLAGRALGQPGAPAPGGPARRLLRHRPRRAGRPRRR